jgi:hypothetical protein
VVISGHRHHGVVTTHHSKHQQLANLRERVLHIASPKRTWEISAKVSANELADDGDVALAQNFVEEAPNDLRVVLDVLADLLGRER